MRWFMGLIRWAKDALERSADREEQELADRCEHQISGACESCQIDDFDARIW